MEQREIHPMRPLDSDADVSVVSVVATHSTFQEFPVWVNIEFVISDCSDQVVRM